MLLSIGIIIAALFAMIILVAMETSKKTKLIGLAVIYVTIFVNALNVLYILSNFINTFNS